MEVPEQVATGIEAASSAEDSSVGTVSHLEWSHIGLRRQFRGLVRVVVQLSNRLDSLESLLALGLLFVRGICAAQVPLGVQHLILSMSDLEYELSESGDVSDFPPCAPLPEEDVSRMLQDALAELGAADSFVSPASVAPQPAFQGESRGHGGIAVDSSDASGSIAQVEHHRALIKWDQLFFLWDASADKRIQEIVAIELVTERHELLEDYMARKAPATMLKRANSMRRLTSLALELTLIFPFTENDLHRVLHVAKSSGAALSQLRSIMEAITFTRFTFDMESLDALCGSRKCWGVGVARLATVVRKADPLRVEDLRKLHQLLREALCLWTRLFAGCALYCCYARCRWSDSQHIDLFTIETDALTQRPAFLCAVIDVHKTMNLRGRLPVHLELAAPGQGVTDDDWVSQFMEVRNLLELGDEHPFMPAPDRSGFATVRALDADEAGDWLGLLLTNRVGLRTTSHSLKCTCLSFAAKFGIGYQDRLVLGGHAHSGRMAEVYGRDSMARPLRLLGEVLSAIRSGSFVPDANRAGRFVNAKPSTVFMSEEGHDFCPVLSYLFQLGVFEQLQFRGLPFAGRAVKHSPMLDVVQHPEKEVCAQITRCNMTLVDSEASFKARCIVVCGDEVLHGQLCAHRVKTFSDLAFACGTPQAPPTEDEFSLFCDRVLAPGAPVGDAAKLRRLHFESSAYVTASLKAQVMGQSSDAPKTLPLAEKVARIENQKQRLKGLVFQEELEPAYSLIDAVAHQVEINQLSWLSPSKCPKRDQELRNSGREKNRVLTLQENQVALVPVADQITAHHATPLEVQWCLQRRGLAYDLNQVISWEAHESWVSYLMQHLTRPAPPNYAQVGISQILKADCELFLLMSKEVTQVRASSSGAMEADQALRKLRYDPRITMHLLPLPKGQAAPPATNADPDSPPPGRGTKRLRGSQGGLLAPVKTATLPKELQDCPHLTFTDNRRHSADSLDGGSFLTGAYRHGGVAGARKSLAEFPLTSRLLVQLATQLFPGTTFSTVALFRNLRTPRHSDSNNLTGSCNHVAALTSFSGGGIRVYQGPEPEDLTFGASGVLSFDAHFEHETLPWRDGDRLVLVAFSVGCLSKLSASCRASLLAVGLPLPQEPAAALPGLTTGEPDLGLCLEVFSGTARLSVALQDVGFQVLAFDHRARSTFPTQQLDLTIPDHQQVLFDIVNDNAARLQHIHLAPPCGTCSAARGIPIPEFAEAGLSQPVPLRSEAHPMGLPGLSGSDWDRVQSANILYEFSCKLVRLAVSLGVGISIENPQNSWFWWLPPVVALLQDINGHETSFHACMHGGSRDKLTKLWCSDDRFAPLQALCSRDHKHAPWRPRLLDGKVNFPTAAEAAYPVLLCQRMAELVAAMKRALPPQASLFGPAPQKLRLALERQPRRRRPLVSMYTAYDAWAVPLELAEPVHRLLKCYPKGARVIRRQLCSWGQVRAAVCPKVEEDRLKQVLTSAWTWCTTLDAEPNLPVEDSMSSFEVCGMCSPSNFVETAEIVWVGIPREPEDFLQQAVKVGHPRRMITSDEDPTLTTLLENLLAPRLDCRDKGTSLLERWEQEKEQLAHEEERVMSSLDPVVATVLEGKSTVLLDRLLQEAQYPDVDLVEDIRQGFPLTGWMKNTNVFVPDPRPPKATLSSQLSSASARNRATLAKVASTVSDATAIATWDETLQELEKGWIFEDADVDLASCLIAHRFGVCQGSKVHIYGPCSLPFGTTGSVSGFLRFAREGKKAVPFSSTFKALGLLFDLSKFGEGGKLEREAALVLLFLFGRRPCHAVSTLNKRAKASEGCLSLDPDLKDALAYLKDKALCAPPLKLTADFRRTFYIFTDGSLEDSYAGLGGILYDSLGSPLAFFSGTVPEDVLSALRKQSSHPIYEVELLAVWVAMTLWESALSDAYSVCYLDNEAAQGALIACKSSTLAGTAIVRDILDLEDRIDGQLYACGVP
ncbi:unnamed protein product [Symbiodinium natans]|uniref:Uncharacterized protein n=1 Tax=Symbiodinium natans TaxID=878477 RepID=A0A812GRT6_9DINO|nr:unnamed protein product [Symbiodinium natans]